MPGGCCRPSLADLRSSLADRGLQLDSVSIRVAGEGAAETPASQAAPATRATGARARRSRSAASTRPARSRPPPTVDRAREGQAVWMLA